MWSGKNHGFGFVSIDEQTVSIVPRVERRKRGIQGGDDMFHGDGGEEGSGIISIENGRSFEETVRQIIDEEGKQDGAKNRSLRDADRKVLKQSGLGDRSRNKLLSGREKAREKLKRCRG